MDAKKIATSRSWQPAILPPVTELVSHHKERLGTTQAGTVRYEPELLLGLRTTRPLGRRQVRRW